MSVLTKRKHGIALFYDFYYQRRVIFANQFGGRNLQEMIPGQAWELRGASMTVGINS